MSHISIDLSIIFLAIATAAIILRNFGPVFLVALIVGGPMVFSGFDESALQRFLHQANLYVDAIGAPGSIISHPAIFSAGIMVIALAYAVSGRFGFYWPMPRKAFVIDPNHDQKEEPHSLLHG